MTEVTGTLTGGRMIFITVIVDGQYAHETDKETLTHQIRKLVDECIPGKVPGVPRVSITFWTTNVKMGPRFQVIVSINNRCHNLSEKQVVGFSEKLTQLLAKSKAIPNEIRVVVSVRLVQATDTVIAR